MFDVIEKLLILQDRDRKIFHVKDEIFRVGPERQALLGHAAGSAATLEKARNRGKQIESDRKKLELEVQNKKQLIEKYSIQQFQTKKNDEYKALGQQIETCKADIVKLEDDEITLMEQAETAQKQIQEATVAASEAKKHTDAQIADLMAREQTWKKELAELEQERTKLTVGIDEQVLTRYQRLFKNKGEHVVVGINHGVCGGCHMKLPTQILISAQSQTEIVACPNCSRLVYFTNDMDLTPVD